MEREFKWAAKREDFSILCAYLGLTNLPRRIQMRAVYYDTPDGMLRAQRIGLRLRTENDSTVCCLKLRDQTSCGRHMHEEYECAADTLEQGLRQLSAVGAPSELLAQLSAVPLTPIAQTNFTRLAFDLVRPDFTAELCYDEGTLSGAAQHAPFQEIECELKSGKADVFDILCATLATRFSLTAQPLSKLSRALLL